MLTRKAKRKDFRKEKLLFKDKKRVVQLYCRGKTHKQIEYITGIGSNMSQKIVSSYIKSRNHNWVLTQKQENLVIKMYTAGYGGSSIAKYFNWEEDVVYRILKRKKVKIRPFTHYRTYDVDENFFENINTEKKAYWLGFLVADGCVSEKRRIRLGLSSKDEVHVYKFRDALSSNHPIYEIESNSDWGKFKTTNCTIQSQKMCLDLEKLGVVENKTFKTTLPCIPKNMYRHFIRGYFDGDGSIMMNSRSNNFSISICGYKPFLLEIQSIMMEELGLNKTKLIPEKRIHSLRYGGSKQTPRILDWMYKDSTTYLDRKYQRYLSMI